MVVSEVSGLVLRPVVHDDAKVLFGWLNAADRRATSFQTSDHVTWGDHVAWLGQRIADPQHWHMIALQDGRAVGQVRAEREETGVVVSIYVDETFRNRGVGRHMIEAVCRTAQERWPGLPVVAQVRPDNPTSVAFFARNGFSEVQRQADRVILQRIP